MGRQGIRALPLRGMDAEAEPPWMGLRRGSAVSLPPQPKRLRSQSGLYSIQPAGNTASSHLSR
jgi:hypothetical protein